MSVELDQGLHEKKEKENASLYEDTEEISLQGIEIKDIRSGKKVDNDFTQSLFKAWLRTLGLIELPHKNQNEVENSSRLDIFLKQTWLLETRKVVKSTKKLWIKLQ